MSRPETLRKKIKEWKPDLIINPAAYTAVEQAEDEPELAFTINATAPKVIAEEAEKLKIPLIHYSTDYIFDGEKKTPYKENDTPNPLNVYGESKLLGEQAIQQTIEQHLIIRTSWAYSHRGNNFLNTMLKLFQTQNQIKVIDDQIGAPTTARYIAETTSRLLHNTAESHNEIKGDIYHLTAAGKTTWYDFAKKIYANTKRDSDTFIIPVPSVEYPTKAKRPAMSLLDNKKLIKQHRVIQQEWESLLALEL